MTSAIVFVPTATGRSAPHDGELLVRSLVWLVSAVVAGAVRDVTLAGGPGLGLCDIADQSGCGFVEGASEAACLHAALAVGRGRASSSSLPATSRARRWSANSTGSPVHWPSDSSARLASPCPPRRGSGFRSPQRRRRSACSRPIARLPGDASRSLPAACGRTQVGAVVRDAGDADPLACESVAAVDLAGVQAGVEPLHALRGRAVGEGIGHDRPCDACCSLSSPIAWAVLTAFSTSPSWMMW